MKKLFLFLALLVSYCFSYSQTFQNELPIVDGYVSKVVKQGNLVYIAGNFSAIGVPSTYGTIINLNNSYPLHLNNFPNWDVNVAKADGNGGWYLGGIFTTFGTTQRGGVARINADGSVHPWNPPAVNGNVKVMVISGNTMYIGGDFTSVGSNTRTRLAALDLNTGALRAWNPSVDGTVNTLTLVNNKLYIGGKFNNVNGVARKNLASVDTTNGTLTSWNPNVTASYQLTPEVLTLAYQNSSIFLGGEFDTVMGQFRRYVAAVDTAANTLKSWNPTANGPVRSLLVNGNNIFLGGSFSYLGNTPIDDLALLNAATGAIQPWNANFGYHNGDIYKMTADANKLYLVSGVGSGGVRVLDLSTASTIASKWVCGGGSVFCAEPSGSNLYVGGQIKFSGTLRPHLAAFDIVNKVVTPWTVEVVNGEIYDFHIAGNTVYAAGNFNIPKNRLIAFDLTTGLQKSWDPDVNDDVNTITPFGSNLIVGGKFTTINGSVSRNRVAMVDMTTGTATSWNPDANGGVLDVEVSGNNIYLAGEFTTLGGQSRVRLGVVDATTGVPGSWNPVMSGISVKKIKLGPNNVAYVGGQFYAVNGVNRGNVAKFDLNTGNLLPWNPNASKWVAEIELHANNVYLGGNFINVNTVPIRPVLVAVDSATGVVTNWQSNLSGLVASEEVRSIYIENNSLIAGGKDFSYGSNPGIKNLVQYGNLPQACTMPVITQQPVAQSGCEGTATSFSVAATGSNLSYQWKDNGNNMTGAIASTLSLPGITNSMNGHQYSVDVTASGCSPLTSSNALLTVNPKPSANYNVVNPQCKDHSYVYENLSTGTISQSTWYFGDGTAPLVPQSGNALHFYSNTATYQVKLVVKTAAGCSDSITKPIVVQVCTSIPGTQASVYSLSVLPNLVNSTATLQMESTRLTTVRLSLFNSTGGEVMKLEKQASPGISKWLLDMTRMPAGVYYLKAVDQQGRQREVKFVKQ